MAGEVQGPARSRSGHVRGRDSLHVLRTRVDSSCDASLAQARADSRAPGHSAASGQGCAVRRSWHPLGGQLSSSSLSQEDFEHMCNVVRGEQRLPDSSEAEAFS
eukprot:4002025-Pyramimonas_sp.AAC.1